MRILLGETDTRSTEIMCAELRRTGLAVDSVRTPRELNIAMLSQTYECVVIDTESSGQKHPFFCQFKQARSPRPALIASLVSHEASERTAMLEDGADDCMVSPVNVDELLARIRSITRRHAALNEVDGATTKGELNLSRTRFKVTWRGVPVSLTHREFWVLEALVRLRSGVVSRARLEEAIYQWGDEVSSNAVEVFIHNLRKKIHPDLIQTVKGLGYQLASVDVGTDA